MIINNQNIPTLEETTILLEKYKYGDKAAKEELILRHYRLAFHEAANYAKKSTFLNEEDLQISALLGLSNAIDHYDSEKYTNAGSFSTYAVYWIRQQIFRDFYDYESIIRVPQLTLQKYLKVQCMLDSNYSLTKALEKNELSLKNYLDTKHALHVKSLNIVMDDSLGTEQTELIDLLEDKNANFENNFVIDAFWRGFFAELTNHINEKNLTLFIKNKIEEIPCSELARDLDLSAGRINQIIRQTERRIHILKDKYLRESHPEAIYHCTSKSLEDIIESLKELYRVTNLKDKESIEEER